MQRCGFPFSAVPRRAALPGAEAVARTHRGRPTAAAPSPPGAAPSAAGSRCGRDGAAGHCAPCAAAPSNGTSGFGGKITTKARCGETGQKLSLGFGKDINRAYLTSGIEAGASSPSLRAAVPTVPGPGVRRRAVPRPASGREPGCSPSPAAGAQEGAGGPAGAGGRGSERPGTGTSGTRPAGSAPGAGRSGRLLTYLTSSAPA